METWQSALPNLTYCPVQRVLQRIIEVRGHHEYIIIEHLIEAHARQVEMLVDFCPPALCNWIHLLLFWQTIARFPPELPLTPRHCRPLCGGHSTGGCNHVAPLAAVFTSRPSVECGKRRRGEFLRSLAECGLRRKRFSSLHSL